MRASEYREIVRKIVRSGVRKHFPGLRSKNLNDLENEIAVNVHARMYGANVDGVESPLWRKEEPIETAKELMEK